MGLVHVGVLSDPRAPAVVGDLASARGADPGLRVLFVGNSFTSHNAMPQLVKRLAAARVFYAVLTGRDPTGSRFPAGLDEDEARFL